MRPFYTDEARTEDSEIDPIRGSMLMRPFDTDEARTEDSEIDPIRGSILMRPFTQMRPEGPAINRPDRQVGMSEGK